MYRSEGFPMIGISLCAAAVLVSVAAQPTSPPPAAPVVASQPKIAPSSLPASDTRDARVTLPNSGGVKISMPGFSAAAPAAPSTSQRADGLITVPDNTLGPGEALWQRNDRIDSELKLARAEAFLAERVSTLPLSENAWGWGGIGSVWGSGGWQEWGSSGWGGGGWGNVGVISAPRGWAAQSWSSSNSCATSGVGQVDRSSVGIAQRQFSEAARPKIAHIENARAEAVRQFGRVAAGQAVPGGSTGPGGTGVPPVISRKGRQDSSAPKPARPSRRAK